MPPWLILAALLATVIALIYQIATRRFGWRVLVYIAIVLAGMLGAEALAESAGITLVQVGELRLIPDLSGALVVVGLLWFLGA